MVLKGRVQRSRPIEATRSRGGRAPGVRALAAGALALAVLVGSSQPQPAQAQDGWQPLAEGIGYRQFYLSGPNVAYVARLERSNPRLIIDSGLAKGELGAGAETVSDMTRRYEQTINSWGGTWGNRNHVVVAINGSFYERSSGVARSGIVHSGTYTKWYGNLGGTSGFAWTLDRQAFIGQCVYHRPEKQVLTYLSTSTTQKLDGIDIAGEEDDLILITPESGLPPSVGEGRANLIVQLDRPLLILPLPAMARGTIRDIRDGQPLPILPFDYIILSASGTARDLLLHNARLGDQVGVSLEITDLGPDCETPEPRDWTKTYAGVSGSFDFLLDGEVRHFDDLGALARHPRTAICYNDEWIYFVVVDGRDPGRSIGMTIDELGAFCRNTLGATWGINQDGGGSSTMWVNGVVRNRPSDGSERAVANSLMMIVLESPDNSTRFAPGQEVVTVQDAPLRLGPGDNFGVASLLPVGIRGKIQAHTSGTDGVFARGTHWWQVAYSRTVGWVDETMLEAAGQDSSPLFPDTWPPPPRGE